MFIRFVMIGATAGLAIPFLLMAMAQITHQSFGITEVMLWPSSFLLMANEGHEGEPVVWVNMSTAIGINIAWYIIGASILYVIFRINKKFTDSKP